MNAQTKKQIQALNKMKLPALQARFAEVVGETSRSPNRVFLIRRITEKLTAETAATSEAAPEIVDSTAPSTDAAEAASGEGGAEADGDAAERDPPDGDTAEGGAAEDAAGGDVTQGDAAAGDAAEGDGTQGEGGAKRGNATKKGTTRAEAKPLSQLSVPQLRKLYVQEVGRPTASTDKAYLIWKLREARKGRVPVGPKKERARAEPGAFMVLPFRLPTRTVTCLDQAWERHEYSSRTEFLRAAVRAQLKKDGEAEVAALFEPQEKGERSGSRAPAPRLPRVRATKGTGGSGARGGRGRAGGRRAAKRAR